MRKGFEWNIFECGVCTFYHPYDGICILQKTCTNTGCDSCCYDGVEQERYWSYIKNEFPAQSEADYKPHIRLGFDWSRNCWDCRNACALLGWCEFDLSNDIEGHYANKCYRFKFDDLIFNRLFRFYSRLAPNGCRIDMFSCQRDIVWVRKMEAKGYEPNGKRSKN